MLGKKKKKPFVAVPKNHTTNTGEKIVIEVININAEGTYSEIIKVEQGQLKLMKQRYDEIVKNLEELN